MSTFSTYIFPIYFLIIGCTNENKEYNFSFSDNYKAFIIPAQFRRGHIYVPLSISKDETVGAEREKCTFDFLFDTGTSQIVIDSILNTNDCFGIKYNNSSARRAHTPDGTTYSYPSFVSKMTPLQIKIGDFSFTIPECEIMNYGGQRNGILPVSQLGKKYIININHFEKYVALLPSIENKSDSIDFIIDPYTLAPCIEGTLFINNNDSVIAINGKFIIDIGMTRGITLSKETKIKFPSLYCQDVIYRTINKGNTIAKFQQTPLVLVRLNNILANINLDFSPQMPPGITGVIGNAFLERINFAIDYKKQHFHYNVIPTSLFPYRSESNSIKKWGIIIANVQTKDFNSKKIHTNPKVVQQVKGEKADMLGVELNDQIIEIDGELIGTHLNDTVLMRKIRNAEKILIQKTDGTLIILD